ncbi:hypothetical protein K435DRAFT_850362 [Dendrothele bispora CBS 962.96]|uniref:Ctf8-domain-containing protein n=1 Tax=Dendrothele bispora (strain CBS 962.96) TaxID=1314807 RepID=A0A4S8MQ45_DENBC|nr:hypothetical protein K435DRAFT_850362 [Dendrothele bispora CBS 962.96]
MIIPINLNSSSSSAQKLPPYLAKISHDEVVLIELQGELELQDPTQRNGRLVGTLKIDDDLKKPTLRIGPHLVEGKLVNLPKPLAVLNRSSPLQSITTSQRPPHDGPGSSEDDMDVDDQSGGANRHTEDLDDSVLGLDHESGKEISWDAIAIVKRKIVFSKRPIPMVGKVA